VLWAALVVFALAYCGWRALFTVSAEGGTLPNRLAFVLVGLATVSLAWLASRAPGVLPTARRAWLLLALAFLAIEAGNALWLLELYWPALRQLALGNAGWLSYYPLLLGGILSLPRETRTGHERRQFWLDTASVVCGGAMLVVYLVGVPTASALQGRQAALSFAYPLGDVVLLTALAMLALRRRREPARLAYQLLTAGLVVELVGDIAWGGLSLGGASYGIFPDLAYMAGWTLRGSAALAYRRRAGTTVPRQLAAAEVLGPTGTSLLPYGAALLGYTTLFLGLDVASRPTVRVLACGAAALTALALLSQWLTSRDNARLQTAQVERRSELRFRTLVQSSSDLIVVVDAEGALRYLAPSAERILGRSFAAALDRPFADLFHPEDRLRLRLFLAQAALSSGVSGSVELRTSSATGWITMEAVATNLLAEPEIAGIVLSLRDIRERKALEDELMQRALHDPLTGLANRALFRDRLHRARHRSQRDGSRFAVLVADLDDFKAVNDGLGHPAGDQVLVEMAHRLGGLIRDTDTAARLGGDEFAILLEGIRGDEGPQRAAQAMLRASVTPFALMSREVRLSASVGVALSTPELDDDEVLRQADLALYHAKESGKGRVALFVPGMQSEMLRRHGIESELRRALERGELFLVYQPIFSLRSGRWVGAEALLRWRHPERGVIAPAEFIDLAESSGLIEPMGQWALGKACRQAAAWNRDAGHPLYVGVNLSVRQLHEPGIVEQVRGALLDSGMPAELLVCEITETVLAQDPLAAAARLQELKAVGVKLALDDFGTGYSSLGRLRDLPIDILKVDGVFAHGLDNPQGSSLAGAIVELGKAVGLVVVAEGVESAEQEAALRALGCDLAQGYHLGAPVEAAELERRLMVAPVG